MSLCFRYDFYEVIDISNSSSSTCLSGARPDLGLEDNAIVQELAECPPRPYPELIKLDIPCTSSSRSARFVVLRSSPPSNMKVSPTGPFAAKPTKGELLRRLETLSRKPRSMKRKALDSAKKDRSASAKVLKLGESSFSPAKDPKVLSLQSRSGSAAKAKGSSGRAVEQPLAVMPITVWNPPAQSVKPPFSRVEELKRKDSEVGGDGDSLLLNAELAASAVSSILKDSDLKKSSALAVDEALALSLQGVAFVSSYIFSCLLSIPVEC